MRKIKIYSFQKLGIIIPLLSVFLFAQCHKSDINLADSAPSLIRSSSPEEIFRGLVLASGPIAEKVPKIKEISDAVAKLEANPEEHSYRIKYENDLITFVEKNYPGLLEEFKSDIISKDLVRIDKAMKKASEVVQKSITLFGIASQVDVVKAKEIVNTALKEHPDKFNAFFKDVQEHSIQPSQIKARLKDVFGTAIDSLMISEASLRTDDINNGACIVLNLVAAVNVVVYVNGGVVVNAAVAVNAAVFVNIAIAVNKWVVIKDVIPPNPPTLSIPDVPGGLNLTQEELIAEIANLP